MTEMLDETRTGGRLGLDLRFSFEFAGHRPALFDVAALIRTIVRYVSLADPAQSWDAMWPDGAVVRGTEVRRISLGSLELGLHLAAIATGSSGALATLIYGAKRIFSLDLELKTHREEWRNRYHRAKQIADRAESGDDAAVQCMQSADPSRLKEATTGLRDQFGHWRAESGAFVYYPE
jgi:hypothetical protein